ncbi:MAG: polysaccharide deacetylase family protein [Magnetococcus sp. THC-1_WYH]
MLSHRSLGLIVVFSCVVTLLLTSIGLANGRIRTTKYAGEPSRASYLSPGGEVSLSRDLLSLPEERIMAFTFDDGPVERDLEIASLLRKHDASATFFFIGKLMERSPDVVKKVLEEKHEVGYHSYRHQKLSWVSQTDLKEDFRLGKACMTRLGVPVAWFRPPYGLFDTKVIKTAKESGMKTILWTVDPRDWTGIGPDVISKRVINLFHPGAVLLFHSNHAATLQALPEIIRRAKADGYRLVTLTEWQNTIYTVHCRLKNRFCPSSTPDKVAKISTIPEKVSHDGTVTASVSVASEPLADSIRNLSSIIPKKGRHRFPMSTLVPSAQQHSSEATLPFM